MITEQPNDLTWTVDGTKYLLGVRFDPDVREVVVSASFDDEAKVWNSFLFVEATEFAVNRFGSMKAFWEFQVNTINTELDARHGSPEEGEKTWMEQVQDFLSESISVSNERLKVD